MSENKRFYVSIKGLSMEYEAWQLIRLFFEREENIRFIRENEELSDFLPGMLLTVELKDGVSIGAHFYLSIETPQDMEKALSFKVKPEFSCMKDLAALGAESLSMLNSNKILAGSCIYGCLSKAFGKQLPYGSLTGIRPVKLAMECLENNMDKPTAVKKLTEATGMSVQKAGLLYNIATVEHPFLKSDKNNINFYIGIPFCASRCLYCSFTAYSIERSKAMVAPYMDAMDREIELVSQWIRKNGYKIGSVYIGGGTPTALDENNLDRLLKTLNRFFELGGVEFTVEAGRPDTITPEKLAVMLENGVTRTSINPQTMNLSTLKCIGRNHTPGEIEEKYRLARDMGFKNINMDIIAGLPGEDLDMFANTLKKIEEMSPESLTVHTMSVKRASRLFDEKNAYTYTPDDVVEAMIEEAASSAAKMGMRPYYLYRQKNMLANLENTGYAKPGFECLYNIHTMEERQSIVAMGAGAISKFVYPDTGRIVRSDNVKELSQYISRIEEMLERKKAMFQEYETQ